MPGDPFTIEFPPDAPFGRVARHVTRPLLSWLLQLETYRQLYREALSRQELSFARRALQVLDLSVDCEPADLSQVPAHGPLIVAANHPHGAVDGLALLALIEQRRPDVRLLANHWLARIPELRDLCFFVDPFGGPAAPARSVAGLRDAHLWLRRGGALIVFPAGEVAHRRGADGVLIDSPWQATVARLAPAGAHVVPAYIDGQNSRFFYAAGRVHPVARTVLLARELLRKRGGRVQVHLGAVMTPLSSCDTKAATAAFTSRIRRAVEDAPLADEISRLPASACLVEAGAFQVFCAGAARIPRTLREIGRLREVTFRAAGEGTGRDFDLDAFDETYLHLFSWNRERREVVGAYRVGQTDRIVAAAGVEGLYTRTLFRYDRRFVDRVWPALELGRSFVREEYQRHPTALLLLWKGICRYVTGQPQYRHLFGAVSISACYRDSTRALLMRFLEQNHLDADLAALVRATSGTSRLSTTGVDGAAADRESMPVLLRQYLKLNARVVGFNVDPHFHDALDALMVVDLTTVAPAILARYFGREGADAFLAYHAGRSSSQAA
jgi:putative hemolysin